MKGINIKIVTDDEFGFDSDYVGMISQQGTVLEFLLQLLYLSCLVDIEDFDGHKGFGIGQSFQSLEMYIEGSSIDGSSRCSSNDMGGPVLVGPVLVSGVGFHDLHACWFAYNIFGSAYSSSIVDAVPPLFLIIATFLGHICQASFLG